jgi:hypothetical protein
LNSSPAGGRYFCAEEKNLSAPFTDGKKRGKIGEKIEIQGREEQAWRI